MIFYLNPNKNPSGAYSAPQSNKADGLIAITEQQKQLILQYNGFVVLSEGEDGETIIKPDTEAWESWKQSRTKQLKQEKITALSAICEQTIYNGLELELSAGKERFEYKGKDQTNIKAMFDAVVFGATCYPYQSEDGNCRVYNAQDIITLYTSLEGLRTAQLTYYHQLKDLVNTLETAQGINAVTYGQPLEGEYLQHYNKMLAVAQEQMQLVLSKVVQNAV